MSFYITNKFNLVIIIIHNHNEQRTVTLTALTRLSHAAVNGGMAAVSNFRSKPLYNEHLQNVSALSVTFFIEMSE